MDLFILMVALLATPQQTANPQAPAQAASAAPESNTAGSPATAADSAPPLVFSGKVDMKDSKPIAALVLRVFPSEEDKEGFIDTVTVEKDGSFAYRKPLPPNFLRFDTINGGPSCRAIQTLKLDFPSLGKTVDVVKDGQFNQEASQVVGFTQQMVNGKKETFYNGTVTFGGGASDRIFGVGAEAKGDIKVGGINMRCGNR